MTPQGFAKLSLRMCCASLLCLWVAPYLQLMAVSALANWSAYRAQLLPVVAFYLVLVGGLVIIWCYAGLLARFLLPKGCDLAACEAYSGYEQAGLLLLGGCCFLKAVKGFDAMITGIDVLTDDPDMALMMLILAVVLILNIPRRIERQMSRLISRAKH